MAKKFSIGAVNLTRNPVIPGVTSSEGFGTGATSGQYFTPQIMQLLGQNAPTPQLSGMDKFKQAFQNPQVQQSLGQLAPLLFGIFGGPEMGGGALKTFDTQAAIRRQQEEIDAERRQREAALGISQRRLGLEEEKAKTEAEAAKATATYKTEQDRIDRITKASNAFESGLTGMDTSDAQKVTTYALSKARLHGLSWDDTKLFVEQAKARAGLPPIGKKPETPVSIGPKGKLGLPGEFAPGEATDVTGVEPTLVKTMVEQRGGGKPEERNFQAKEIENPADPTKPLWVNYDPNKGKYYHPDTDEVIKGAKPYVAPRVVDPALAALREAGLKQLQYTEEDRMRTQYERDIRDYPKVEDAIAMINETAKQPSGPSDMAMIIAFNKMLDPSSVVRESEYARTATLGSLQQRVEIAIGKLARGEALESALRQEIVNTANKLHKSIQPKYERTRKRYRDMATGRKLNPDYVAPETLSAITPPAASPAIDILPPVNPFEQRLKNKKK